VPVFKGKELPIGTFKAIIKGSGLNEEDWK